MKYESDDEREARERRQREAAGFYAAQNARAQLAAQTARGMVQWRAACDRAAQLLPRPNGPWC